MKAELLTSTQEKPAFLELWQGPSEDRHLQVTTRGAACPSASGGVWLKKALDRLDRLVWNSTLRGGEPWTGTGPSHLASFGARGLSKQTEKVTALEP